MKRSLPIKLFNLFCILVSSFAILNINKATALGGYLSFKAPTNTPSQFDELDFFFRMIKNPGPLSYMYYAHNFAINSSNTTEEQLGGYIGPQLVSNANNRRTSAIVSVWSNRPDRVISYFAGPESKCTIEHGGPESQTGWLIQCAINDNSKFAQTDMPDGTTYKIVIKNVNQNNLAAAEESFEFSIQNLVTKEVTVLGTMTFSNVKGINPLALSHFLENFAGGYDCQTVPYLAYSEDGPIGIRNNKKYTYTVEKYPTAPFDCHSNLAFSENNSSAIVEYAIKGGEH
ncbi:hypothetical protein ABLB69_08555 [Xenorhabdus khoisanae]|uniref:hypothetical protein n=1 Tax=Xenorhabdus khoisanae TaxID=880157 RepID=UPI0032B79B98